MPASLCSGLTTAVGRIKTGYCTQFNKNWVLYSVHSSGILCEQFMGTRPHQAQVQAHVYQW